MRWTFAQRLAAGFAAVVGLTLISTLVSVRALQGVLADKDRVIAENVSVLVDTQRLQNAIESRVAAGRGYLLSATEDRIARMRANDSETDRLLRKLKVDAPASAEQLTQLQTEVIAHRQTLERMIGMRQSGASLEEVTRYFEETVVPRRQAVDKSVDEVVLQQQRALDDAKLLSAAQATKARRIVFAIMAVAVLVATGVAIFLSRRLARDIGTAIQHIRSSSAELQAAANQQVASTREQATSMNEISTTVSELLATSRQIAESAQRVAQMSDTSTAAARSGDKTVRAAQESILAIKQQVDHVVTHMLELGKRSQQIGSVIDIINELAEQTNILSINASIEAAGAGENGRRFAVVAEEIRKLAERTGGSTREINALVEEIRSAVNTTVMATEGGAKAVDAGTRQFGAVTEAFEQIMKLVAASTDAAREIELSTKQQSTAVEQVNIAILNAAQATKESEAGSNQTLQTAGQLATLSGELTRLV